MTDILVVFESRYGQAHKVASFIAELAHRTGRRSKLVHVESATTIKPADYDAVVVVAPIYFGRHPRTIERFLRRRAAILSSVPTAFVSVSNSAVNADAAARASAQSIANAFIDRVGLRARLVTLAGGAFAYPRYGFVVRRVMRLIAKWTGGPQDVSRIHELTDWVTLERECSAFLDVVETVRRRERQRALSSESSWKGSDQSGVFEMADARATANG